MGSCSSEQQNGKGLDVMVGELVWVRRGNGSWWPGQIMDVDEVSDSCLDVGKSSGVPIKLLGRDDVTVEWYILEKTNRVKAFRCGDHDSCIEKAKASKGNPSKRRLKYRRENAIILALQLETALTSKDCDNGSGADNFESEPHGSCSRASPAKCNPPVIIGLNAHSFKEKTDSAPELSHSGISFEEANPASALREGYLDKVKRQMTPNDSEDDGNEGMKKRMKGLDDLGLGSNMKELTGLVTESAPQGLASVSYLSASNCPPNLHLANGSRGGCISFFKKKRSKVLFQDILKRKNRRRMLTKVLQSDTLVSVPIIFDDFPSPRKPSNHDGKVSGLESNDSKRSLLAAIDENNNSDSTGVLCQNGSVKYDSEHSQDAALTSINPKNPDTSSMSELLGYDSLENLFDVPLIYEAELCDVVVPQGSLLYMSSPLKPQNDTSVEQLCRNSPVEVGLRSNETLQESGSTSSAAAHVCSLAQQIEKGPSEWQLKGRRNSRHQNRNPEQDSKRLTDTKDESKADVADPGNQPDQFSPSQHKPFPYRQSHFSVLSSYEFPDLSIRSTYPDSILYNVCIEVKASYRPQHVPYISLMSKLNGKPVTGHPITVEVLENGECDFLVDAPGSCPTNGSHEPDVGDYVGELTEPRRHPLKKQLVLQPHFSPSKSPKAKKQGSSSAKKTRRLSALTGSHSKLASSLKERKLVVRSLKGPAIACVPLKVVFSRINEALNGSMRANRVS